MNRIAAAALAAAVFVMPGAAPARPAAPAPGSLQEWALRVEKALDATLSYPTPIAGQQYESGIVRVKFNCSESGRPDKVSLARSSGSRPLDRAALRAVQRIATLHPLPLGMAHDQQYQANILFAATPSDYAAQVKKLRAEALASNSWFKGPQIAGASSNPVLLVAW